MLRRAWRLLRHLPRQMLEAMRYWRQLVDDDLTIYNRQRDILNMRRKANTFNSFIVW